jgi:hypothetical protein
MRPSSGWSGSHPQPIEALPRDMGRQAHVRQCLEALVLGLIAHSKPD